MRTTVTIEDPLLASARQRAAERGVTVSEIINDALRRSTLDSEHRPAAPPITVFTDGTGPAPGIDLTSNAMLAELIDDDSVIR